MPFDDTTLLALAVSANATFWPPADSGDPNTIDIFILARRLEKALSVTIPTNPPSTHDGVRLVEFVEQQLIGGQLIRGQVPAALGNRAARLAEVITQNHLELGTIQATVVTALYLWHGCILMAKLLRSSYVAKQGDFDYTDALRLEGYASLSKTWMQEETRGNPWVRYGASLARSLELERKGQDFAQLVHEGWVPKDSPYWQQLG